MIIILLSLSVINIINEIVMLLCDFFCSMYVYLKASSTKTTKKKIAIISIVFLFLISFLVYIENSLIISRLYTIVSYIIITCVSFTILSAKNEKASIPLLLISIAISYFVEYFSVIVSGTLLYFLGYREKNIVSTLFIAIFQICITLIIVRSKPFISLFRYLGRDDNLGVGLLISSYTIVFYLLLAQYEKIGSDTGVILSLGIPLALTGLILWIRSIVKRFYKNMLQGRMDEYTKHELEDKDKRIERLEAEVASLAKQVHRDNHLMASVDRSMQSLAECDSAEQREQIIGEIHTLYLERNDSIAKEQQKNKILPSTGISLIDSSLSELYVKAAARGISFDLSVSEELHYLVNNIISQTDLQTLICDHVKDAIIAVEASGTTNGRILVTIEKNDSIFEISIRDSGIDFEADTLAKIGKEQVTTHADSGGSGIGFMTTFETLRKTKGSLIITEYQQKTPFSKSVTFVFDGLNRFIISTYRKEELEKIIDRDDLLII